MTDTPNNIVPLFRDTVAETLQEISEEDPEQLVAFTMKKELFYVHASNIEGVTFVIGALERIKYELLKGQ